MKTYIYKITCETGLIYYGSSKDPYKRIDYIFYTKNSIEYVSGKVLNEFEQASDHLPVQMNFKLK